MRASVVSSDLSSTPRRGLHSVDTNRSVADPRYPYLREARSVMSSSVKGANPGNDDWVDERDTMFARAARRPGTAPYEDYYGRRPELQRKDDRIRGMPALLAPGGRHFEATLAAEARALSDAIASWQPEPARVRRWVETLDGSSDPTAALEAMVRDMGAVAVGCAPLDPAWLYTHKGRFDDDYGQPVLTAHPNVLVFLVEMAFEPMRRAPRMDVIVESCRQYLLAAQVARTVEAALRAAGHDATAHFDAHYDLVLPPAAVAAGLGELGRNNILVADRYGSRVRIGAVSTDLELRAGRPVDLGVQRFCEVCRKCADSCPSRSLSTGELQEIRGVLKWPTTVETCYAYWRSMSSDCGICMAVCPFSHRDTWIHNAVRWMVRHAPWLDRLAVWGDDLVYGRRWKTGS